MTYEKWFKLFMVVFVLYFGIHILAAVYSRYQDRQFTDFGCEQRTGVYER